MQMNALPNLDFEAGFGASGAEEENVNGRVAKRITRGIAIVIGVIF